MTKFKTGDRVRITGFADRTSYYKKGDLATVTGMRYGFAILDVDGEENAKDTTFDDDTLELVSKLKVGDLVQILRDVDDEENEGKIAQLVEYEPGDVADYKFGIQHADINDGDVWYVAEVNKIELPTVTEQHVPFAVADPRDYISKTELLDYLTTFPVSSYLTRGAANELIHKFGLKPKTKTVEVSFMIDVPVAAQVAENGALGDFEHYYDSRTKTKTRIVEENN